MDHEQQPSDQRPSPLTGNAPVSYRRYLIPLFVVWTFAYILVAAWGGSSEWSVMARRLLQMPTGAAITFSGMIAAQRRLGVLGTLGLVVASTASTWALARLIDRLLA